MHKLIAKLVSEIGHVNEHKDGSILSRRHDIQHNDIQHNDTQHKGLICNPQQKNTPYLVQSECRYGVSRFIKCYAECHYAECRYVECRYAECHYTECRYAECHYAECCYVECHYAECCGAFVTSHGKTVGLLFGAIFEKKKFCQ